MTSAVTQTSETRFERVITDDGVSLAVTITGSGPGLLLVHGFGGAKEDFSDHVPQLARDHTVVTFDHRGHGESDKPDSVDSYSFERLLADTLTVADATGLGTFTLLGHSMGGMVVRRIPLRHPERVRALVLMDTCGGPIEGFDPEIMELGATIALTEGKDALKAALDMADPLNNPAYQRLLQTRPGYVEYNDYKWAMQSEFMWAALARAIAYQDDDLPAMAALDLPTLVLVGELDVPFRGPADAFTATIAGAELVVIPDAGHSPQFECPDVWISAMDAFLARVHAR